MNEFVENDVLAEIGNEKILWVVYEVAHDGYFVNAYFDGKLHVFGNWMGFRTAHNRMVKVDEWDAEKECMRGIDNQD